MQGEFAKALETGYAQYDNDSSLTMLRAMALAKTLGTDSTSMIGENLFKYEITGNSRSLFPQTDRQCLQPLADDRFRAIRPKRGACDDTETPDRKRKPASDDV